MPTYENSVSDAADAQNALRGLAHALNNTTDPRDLYDVLGWLAPAAARLSQDLHQLAQLHDRRPAPGSWAPQDTAADRSAAYQVSWELHRAGEIMHQVAQTIDRAHETESTITYTRRNDPDLAPAPPSSTPATQQGLGL